MKAEREREGGTEGQRQTDREGERGREGQRQTDRDGKGSFCC